MFYCLMKVLPPGSNTPFPVFIAVYVLLVFTICVLTRHSGGDAGNDDVPIFQGSGSLVESTGTQYPMCAMRWGNFEVTPEDVGLQTAGPDAMRGASPSENAATMRELLSGKLDSPLRDAVALNAGAGLLISGVEES